MSYHGAECHQCKHFVPHRRESGRLDKKHYGACQAVVEWPIVPICYGRTWTPPERRPVWWDTNAEACHCFAQS